MSKGSYTLQKMGGGEGGNDTTRKKILMTVALHIPCLVGYRERYNSS